MTSKTKVDIKAFFQTGDTPTEAQCIDLIDSYVDKSGPLGVLETNVSGGSQGFVFASASDAKIISGASALTFIGVATTAQANAGTATGVIMDPVLVKNAVTALGYKVVLLGTATASASATLEFTSLITSSYSHYMFVFEELLSGSTSILQMGLSTNNGSTYAVNLRYQVATITPGGTTGPTYSGNNNAPGNLNTSTASLAITGKVELYHPLSAAGAANYSGQINLGSNSTNVFQFWGCVDTGAINAVRFLPSTGTFTSGKIYMYGLKNT